jgi:phospholipid transport system transporter-binding protein
MSSRAILSIDGNTLTLSGELDHESVLRVDAEGQQWLRGQAQVQCNIELSGVTYTSSAGIALLLGWLRVAEQQHKTLHILRAPANLIALAKVGGLEGLFT